MAAVHTGTVNCQHGAREMAHDLENQSEVGVAERPEAAEWEKRQSPEGRRWLMYAGLALIPLVIFVVMFLVAKQR